MASDPERHTWQQLEPEFREDWETEYAGSGVHWGEIREAHLFGWTMARRPEFAGRCWDDAENDLRYHWYRPELTSEDVDWDISRVAAKAGWARSRQMTRGTQC